MLRNPTICLATTLCFATNAEAQGANQSAPTQDDHCIIKTENQSSGQAGCLIQNYGRLTDFGSALVIQNQGRTTLSAVLGTYAHFGLYDTSDPVFSSPGNQLKYFLFIATETPTQEDDTFGSNHRCRIDDDTSVVGLTITERPGDVLTLNIQMLPKSDAALNSICRGLAAPAPPSAELVQIKGDTNYKAFHNRALEYTAILLAPGRFSGLDFERRYVDHYWSSLLGANIAEIIAYLASAYQDGKLDQSLDDVSKEGHVSLTIAMPEQSIIFGGLPKFSVRATKKFGSDLEKMDQSWGSYTSKAGITATRLSRFRAADLAGRNFWLHLNDGSRFMASADCTATTFIVDNHFATIAELPSYRTCGPYSGRF